MRGGGWATTIVWRAPQAAALLLTAMVLWGACASHFLQHHSHHSTSNDASSAGSTLQMTDCGETTFKPTEYQKCVAELRRDMIGNEHGERIPARPNPGATAAPSRGVRTFASGGGLRLRHALRGDPLPLRPIPSVQSTPSLAKGQLQDDTTGHPGQSTPSLAKVQLQDDKTGHPGLNSVNGTAVFVVTYSNNANKFVCNLLWSAMKFNVSVKVLGFVPPSEASIAEELARASSIQAGFLTGGESSSFQDLRRLDALEMELHHLSAAKPHAIVLWLDADVLFQQPLQPAVRAFQAMAGNPSLVWSAEKTCWPPSALCSLYQGGFHAFLNCGAAIGYLHAFLRFFEVLRRRRLPNNAAGSIMMEPITVSNGDAKMIVAPSNDQELVQALFADEETNRYVGGMALDHDAQIFFSLGGGGSADLVENPDRGPADLAVYRRGDTGSAPVVLHFNGESKSWQAGSYYHLAQRRQEPLEFQVAVLKRSLTVLQVPRMLCSGCSVFWIPFTDPAYPIGFFKRVVDFWRDNATFVHIYGTLCEKAGASCTPEDIEFYAKWELSYDSIAGPSDKSASAR